MYDVGQEMARTINTRHDVNLHAMPGEERPALVLEEVGDERNLAVFLRSGRTWMVRAWRRDRRRLRTPGGRGPSATARRSLR